METIGDAYMVVCGVPEPREDHARRVADFALGAVMAAQQVKAPATGKPLQVMLHIKDVHHTIYLLFMAINVNKKERYFENR